MVETSKTKARSKAKSYSNTDITLLKGADRVRKRPAVIFGSDGIDGCEHSVFEIVSNSIDEARDGHGDRIVVTKYEDWSVEVEDFGRGIPMDYNESEKRYNWDLIFCEMYAGGKYADSSNNYEYSLGLNGLGLCATQYSSSYMDAEVCRDGYIYRMHFEEGNAVGELQKEATNRKKTGSRIKWMPDKKVFTDIKIGDEYYHRMMKQQAVVNQGVTFELRIQKGGKFETTVYKYDNGILDYLKELSGDNALTTPQFIATETQGRDHIDRPEYKVKLNVAYAFSNHTQQLEYYHNSSFLEHGGSPDRAVKQAFTYQIDAYIKQAQKYQKGESKITFADISDCLILVSSSFSTQTSFENQTKKAITNPFISTAMTDFLKRSLEVYFIENPEEAAKIADQVLINKRSREKAESTRKNLKKTLTDKVDMANRVQKFIDCRTKDVSKRELYIVEGDSAMGSCKQSRDSEFQAIMPVRGKILNCLKADYTRIFKSDIITDLLKVMGCGVEVTERKHKDLSSFDINNLRWNKVIICTDADVDGFQIRTLILTMLYRLTPTLINEGYVYIAESPLYEITTNDMTYFAYDESEKGDILKRIGNKKHSIARSKGLGENDPEMMWMTTMNPESRRLIKVTPTDVKETAEMFDLLLGDNLQGRKDFIAEFGENYLDNIDVS